MSRATNDIMDRLHGELATSLLNRIKSGEATAADLNVVRQFLKDNGIDATPAASKPLADLVSMVPFAVNQ
jgi:hypothetical protein